MHHLRKLSCSVATALLALVAILLAGCSVATDEASTPDQQPTAPIDSAGLAGGDTSAPTPAITAPAATTLSPSPKPNPPPLETDTAHCLPGFGAVKVTPGQDQDLSGAQIHSEAQAITNIAGIPIHVVTVRIKVGPRRLEGYLNLQTTAQHPEIQRVFVDSPGLPNTTVTISPEQRAQDPGDRVTGYEIALCLNK